MHITSRDIDTRVVELMKSDIRGGKCNQEKHVAVHVRHRC